MSTDPIRQQKANGSFKVLWFFLLPVFVVTLFLLLRSGESLRESLNGASSVGAVAASAAWFLQRRRRERESGLEYEAFLAQEAGGPKKLLYQSSTVAGGGWFFIIFTLMIDLGVLVPMTLGMRSDRAKPLWAIDAGFAALGIGIGWVMLREGARMKRIAKDVEGRPIGQDGS